MEKQNNGGGEEAKRFTRQKIFGSNSLQIGEDDASGLVGRVVEKGISEKPLSSSTSISLPKPTVLPFPVARHRSHGPVSAYCVFFNSVCRHFDGDFGF